MTPLPKLPGLDWAAHEEARRCWAREGYTRDWSSYLPSARRWVALAGGRPGGEDAAPRRTFQTPNPPDAWQPGCPLGLRLILAASLVGWLVLIRWVSK